MTVVVVVPVLCSVGIAFMGWFFIALCKERQRGMRHVVHIRPKSRPVVHAWPVQSPLAGSGHAYVGRRQV